MKLKKLKALIRDLDEDSEVYVLPDKNTQFIEAKWIDGIKIINHANEKKIYIVYQEPEIDE